jgi:cyclopropane fatty-acyl-phospholipid synthase-like methyltransferase
MRLHAAPFVALASGGRSIEKGCEIGPMIEGAQTAPAVARNRDPILAVLRRVLPARGTVLEIASGTGEHAVHFAAGLPHLAWQPTDLDPSALRSIAAYRRAAQLPNLLAPLELDATSPVWPAKTADAIVSINMIHIAPWRAAEGLMAGAARLLAKDQALYLYGPFKENGRHTAPSNAAFDASLMRSDPEWGVRDIGDVSDLASQHGFDFTERIAMPANNLSVIFRRRAG